MKKNMYIMTLAVVLFAVWAILPVHAQDVRRLPIDEAAIIGATHEVLIDYADFTETTTNTAETLTVGVDAKQTVEFVAMILDTAFDETTTNTTLTLKIGDGGDDDYLMASTQIAADGTEVWAVLAQGDAGTVAITPQTTDVETDPVLTLQATTVEAAPVLTLQYTAIGGTNLVTNVTVATTTSTLATNATAAFSVSALVRKVYTSDDTIDFVFTPSDSAEALDDFSAGQLRVYLKILDAR